MSNSTGNKTVNRLLSIIALLGLALLAIESSPADIAQAEQEVAHARTPFSSTSPLTEPSTTISDGLVSDDSLNSGVLGANCSSPAEFDNQWANGYRLVCQNNLYVLMVDLTNPAVKVEVIAATSGTQAVSSYADSNTIAVINADYQWCASGAICSQGLTMSNGSSPTTHTNISHLCSDALVRREIGFSQDGRVTTDWWYKFVSDSQARSWCGNIPGSGGGLESYGYNLVGGGPQITFNSTFRWDCGYGYSGTPGASDCLASGSDVVINDEHFGSSATNWWNRYQSAIGYSSDGTALVLAESNNQTHTLQEVHNILFQRLNAYGKTLKNTFKFDGGSKAGFWYYNNTYNSTPGVLVPNVIRIQRTNSTCYSLSTSVNPGGAGSVNVNTASNCAQGKYLPGTNVQLAASANSGYSFSNWSGDASGNSNPIIITMNGNKNVTANFSAIPTCYTLSTSVNPSGVGNITLNPGPNCNGTQYTAGTVVQLTASANTGYSFANWSGDASGSANPVSITMSGNKTVTANFAQTCNPPSVPPAPTLLSPPDNESVGTTTPTLDWADIPSSYCLDYYHVQIYEDGGGQVDIAWPTSSSYTVPAGKLIWGQRYIWYVWAHNSLGFGDVSLRSFWVGQCYTLVTSVSPSGAGNVSVSPGPNCAGGKYTNGTVVQLTATANAGYTFSSWSGDASGSANPLAVTTNWNKSIVANFAPACPTITEWKGEYWSNASLSGNPTLCRNEFTLDFDWGLGSPDPSIPADFFSARWTRPINFPAGLYRFHMDHDDGARLFVDDVLKIDSWGTCCGWDMIDISLSAGNHTIRMEMFEAGGAANADLWWERLDISGWRGEYYNNETLSDHPILIRDDGASINFEWLDQSPDPLVQRDHFSVRWTRSVPFATGTYRFNIFHDDGARLYIDGNLAFENWCGGCRQSDSVALALVEGPHNLKLEMRENIGWATSQLTWQEETPRTPPMTDDFEINDQAWQTTGFWHRVEQSVSPYAEAHSPTHSFWYGQDATGNYDNGAANSGNLTSPPIFIPSGAYALKFWYWYQTETAGTIWDQRLVQISTDGVYFTTVAQLSGDDMQTWLESPPINLSAYAGQVIYVRFRFDTVGSLVNNFRGWYMDDVSIYQIAQPPDIQVTPASLSANLVHGESLFQTLTIANVGAGNLDFQIVEENTTPSLAYAPLRFPPQKVQPGLQEALSATSDKPSQFIVYLAEQADLSRANSITDWTARGQYVRDTLWNTAQKSQSQLLNDLNTQTQLGNVTAYQSFYIVNAILVKGNSAALQALAARPDVAYIEPVTEYPVPEPIPGPELNNSTTSLEWGISKIRADQVWADFGVRGEGVVVANIDTGVMYTHTALINQYRGTATGSNNYNWFDPTGTFPAAPGDNNGHGTHTMGTMVGDDGAGNQIGVAPGAKWIAAKGCATNSCSSADLLVAAQWVLAPYPIGGSPANGDASKRPNVVNNSWGGGGGSLWYQASVNAWRAADIFPAFAAGNAGPGAGTVGSPGDYAESFASGATDLNDNIASFSSRGPSSLTNETKPDVSAPGVGVRSAFNDGGYVSLSGASMASPHTAGCVALLKSLKPSLTVTDLEHLLTDSAVDRGAPGPDFDYGFGRLDCRAAAELISPVPWLSETPITGTVAPNASQVVTVTFTANQPIGTYTAYLRTNSNDPDTNPVIVPVTLTVRAPDIQVVPLSFNEFTTPGSVLNRTLTITNTGNAPLSYGLTDTAGEYQMKDSTTPGGPTFSWIEISGTGTNLGLSDDSYAYISIPFNFDYAGSTNNHVAIGSNGIVYFQDAYLLGYINSCIPASSSGTDKFIAGLWDDLNPAAGGGVYSQMQGSAPNRKLVVEWSNVPHYSNIGATTFEIILYEGGNDILIQYLDVDFGNPAYDLGASATSGVQSSFTSGRQYHCNTPSLSNNLAVRYFRNDWLSTAPASGTVPAGSNANVTVTMNATNLTTGAYTATLNIASNDPDENPVLVPVNLTVGQPGGPVVLATFPVTTTTGISQTFSLEVRVRAYTQTVDGAAAYLNFNPAFVHVVSLTPGTALPTILQNSFDNAVGQINFVAGALGSPPSGEFTLVTVTFMSQSSLGAIPLAFNSLSPRKSDVTYGGSSVLHHTESGTIVITSNIANVNGSVTLQGRPAPPHSRWITPLRVKLTIPSSLSPSYVFTPTTDNTGHFTLTGINPGAYEVLVKNSHTLQNKLMVTLANGNNSVNLGALLEGDANDDNEVGLLDFSILATTFFKCQGDAGYDDRADFNEDQCVNLLDFTLLALNFGRSGSIVLGTEPPITPHAGSAQLVIVPPTSTVEAGQVFTVTVQVQAGADPVSSAQASLDFDPDFMRVQQITPGTSLPLTLLNKFDNTAGTVDYAAGTLSNFPSGTLTLLQIRFQVLVGASSTSSLTFHLGGQRNSDVTFGEGSVFAGKSDGIIVIPAVPPTGSSKIYLPLITKNP